jgi:hypothetical protein
MTYPLDNVDLSGDDNLKEILHEKHTQLSNIDFARTEHHIGLCQRERSTKRSTA